MRKVVFIGGPLDKEERVVPDDSRYLSMTTASFYTPSITFSYIYQHEYKLMIDIFSGNPYPFGDTHLMVYMGCSMMKDQHNIRTLTRQDHE